MAATNATPKKRTRTRDWKPAFLKAFAMGPSPNISRAAKVAGVHRSTVDRARKQDDEFAAAMYDAANVSVDAVEEALFGAAVKLDTPGAVTAAIFVLKNWRSERYGDKPTDVRVEHAGHVATGGARELMALTDEEFAEVEHVLDRAQARRADV